MSDRFFPEHQGDRLRVARRRCKGGASTITEGKKRCEFFWLLETCSKRLGAGGGDPNSAQAILNIRRRSGLDLALTKMLRKHHYQAMEDPEIDPEIKELLQNRCAWIK